LVSYGATKRAILPGVEHRQHRYLKSVRRIHLSRRASARTACRGSHRRVMHSSSSPRMGLLHSTSDRAATGSPPLYIARSWPTDSKCGTKSQGLPQPKGSDADGGISLRV
jgi:hypothetical protein